MEAMDYNTWQWWPLISLVAVALFYLCFLLSTLSCVTVDAV